MGIRNKVSSTGWTTEIIAGTDTEVDMSNAMETIAPRRKVQVARSGSATTATAPVLLVAGATVGTTASLPAISTSTVGRTILVMSSGSQICLLSASNAINGGTWTRVLQNPFSIVTCIAATTDSGFTWVATSGSAL